MTVGYQIFLVLEKYKLIYVFNLVIDFSDIICYYMFGVHAKNDLVKRSIYSTITNYHLVIY